MAILADKNITTNIVGNAVGSGSRKVSELCTHSGIRPWSKYKPVKFNHDSTEGYPEWWKGDDGYCGFSFSILSTLDQLKGEYASGNNWKYLTIPSDYPKRLGDFRGYCTTALAPIIRVNGPTNPTNQPGSIILFTYIIKLTPDAGELSFADFKDVGDGYLGAAIYYNSGSFYRAATSSSTLGSGGNLVTFDGGGWKAGIYKAYPFLATKNKIPDSSIGSLLPDNRYVVLPNADEIIFEVKESSIVISPQITIFGKVVLRTDEWGLERVDIDVIFSIIKLGSTELHVFDFVLLDLFYEGADGIGTNIYNKSHTWNSWDVDMNDPSTTSIKYTFEGVNSRYKDNDSSVKVTLSKNSDWSKSNKVIRFGN